MQPTWGGSKTKVWFSREPPSRFSKVPVAPDKKEASILVYYLPEVPDGKLYVGDDFETQGLTTQEVRQKKGHLLPLQTHSTL